MSARLRKPLLWLLALALIAIGIAALDALLNEVRPQAVRAALHATAPGRIALALLFTACSYLLLTLYDTLAARTIGRRLPWKTTAVAAFTSYTLSHNLGFSLLTGGSARLKAYRPAGLSLADVARITIIASVTFWMGVLALTGVALLFAHHRLAVGMIAISGRMQTGLGLTMLALIAAAMAARLAGLSEARIGRWTIPVPPASLIAGQAMIGALDIGCAAAALYVLLPQGAAPAFGPFCLAYALGITMGLVTHVPGGIGVFEATILALTPGGRAATLAALLLYRVIYYLMPLAVALALIGRKPLAVLRRAVRIAAPYAVSLLVFAGGLVLLVSGALPAEHRRLVSLRDILPLPFVEASHFAASLIGTALLLTAPALQARLKSGFQLARALLIVGATFSLLKGFDYEEALVLAIVAALLQSSRAAFYRRAGIGSAPLERWWWAAALIALSASIWAGLLAYKHIAYSDDLWWSFTWHGNAPRFLRATLGATVAIGVFAYWRLVFAPTDPGERRRLPDTVADRALAAARRADAMLAFTGDKRFLASAAGDAFLMYDVRARTWVVMGDPVGAADAWPELCWELRRRCDTAHGRLCFYQASVAMLPLLVDLGLQPIKYGEEALVDLTGGYTLKGSRFRSLRHSTRKAEAAGLRFGIIPASGVAAIMPSLQRISDAWLAEKPGGEKGFSLGRFDPAYLARFDCAVLRDAGGDIVAFANIWRTQDRSELSVDLMRHLPIAPYGAMDLLLVNLMQWGAANGFDHFNLGLAPLSGLPGQRLAPFWSRLGALLRGRGERLYGFEGLRAFKAKYAPRWEPRYIATSPGLPAARALVDVAALIGRRPPLSEPEPHAGDQIPPPGILPPPPGETGGIAQAPFIFDADIGREFRHDFVAEAEPCLDGA